MQFHHKKIEELDLDTLVTTFANKHPCRILLVSFLSNMHVRIQLQFYMCIENQGHRNTFYFGGGELSLATKIWM